LNPPLSRLERLSFEWVDSFGNIIDNNNADWSAVVYVTERLYRTAIGSTWIAPR
jgi:hypothetical protein